MGSFESNVATRFAPGTKLDVLPRVGFSPGAAEAVKSTSVGSDGAVKVTGLEDNAPYWLSDGETHVAIVAKTDELRSTDILERASRRNTNAQVQAERDAAAKVHRSVLASAAPGKATTSNVVTGARSSKPKSQVDLTEVQPEIREQIENRQQVDPDPRPAPNQLDVSGVLQRSDTPFGSATPKEKDEIVPAPSQSDVSGLQRSDTPEGQATPKDKAEVSPALDQDDVKKSVVQSSDTEDGEATPKRVQSKAKGKAAVKSALDAQKKQNASAAKASGESVKPAAKTGSKKSPADRVKGKSPARQGKDQ